jgi:hypothetical protein
VAILDVFSRYYRENYWGNAESRSGPGSTYYSTYSIRDWLPYIVKQLGIESILDGPCGDYNWMRHVVWLSPVYYIGVDIVPEIVEDNSRNYKEVDFRVLDIVKDPLPPCECLLSRDCWQHLPNEMVLKCIDSWRDNDEYQYLIAGMYPDSKRNEDIEVGGSRAINLMLPPFELGPSLSSVEDCRSKRGRRQLCLWGK